MHTTIQHDVMKINRYVSTFLEFSLPIYEIHRTKTTNADFICNNTIIKYI